MDKARKILIYLNQLRIVGMCQHERRFLVRDMRHDDHCIHTALCRIGERRDHIVIQNQIRSHDVHIFSRLVDDVQVELVSDRLPVDRAVGKRNGKAVHVELRGVEIIAGVQISAVIEIGVQLFHTDVPHLEKHHGKIIHRIAL